MTSLPPMFGTFPADNLFDAATAIVFPAPGSAIAARLNPPATAKLCILSRMLFHVFFLPELPSSGAVVGSAIKWITAAAWRVQQGEACGADAMTGHTVIADLVRFYGAGGGAGVVEDAGAKTTHMACLKRYLDTYLAMLI